MTHLPPKSPTAPAGAPPYAVAMLRDLVAWVRTIANTPSHMPSFTVSNLPDAADAYSSVASNPHSVLIFVTNESGGAVPAFTDGTNWRRVTDRAIVS